MSGRFIALEGGEGVGKSTQMKRLAAALRKKGLEVVLTREPGGSPGAEAIRFLLLTGSEDRWSPRAEALMFAAARADHVDKTIRPALARGAWVISDRFIDSSLAYQGVALGLGIDAVKALHRFGSEDFLPDRTLLLTLPDGEGHARAQRRDAADPDRIGGRDTTFHDRVAQGFETLLESEGSRIVRVDASGTPDAVEERLMAALADLLP